MGDDVIVCGPRLRVDKFVPIGEGIGAELTGQIGAEPIDGGGPIGVVVFGNCDRRE